MGHKVKASGRKPKKKVASSPASGVPVNFEMTSDLSRAFDLMENTNEHLYITGKAGTGKSTLLQYFKQKNREENRHTCADRHRSDKRRRLHDPFFFPFPSPSCHEG